MRIRNASARIRNANARVHNPEPPSVTFVGASIASWPPDEVFVGILDPDPRGKDTLEIAPPAGVQEGDLLLCNISNGNYQSATTAPSGWTLLIDGGGNPFKTEIWQKTATASEPSLYTFTKAQDANISATMIACRSSTGSFAIEDETYVNQTGGGPTLVPPTVTNTVAGSMYVSFVSQVTAKFFDPVGIDLTPTLPLIEGGEHVTSGMVKNNDIISGVYYFEDAAVATHSGYLVACTDNGNPKRNFALFVNPL